MKNLLKMLKMVSAIVVGTCIAVFGIISIQGAFNDEPQNDLGPDKLVIKIGSNTSPSDKQLIARAAGAFFQHCSDLLNKYAGDIERINAYLDVLDTKYSYQFEAYGWKKMIRLQIKIKDDPRHIPATYRTSGHTLHYQLGTGHSPGYITKKDQAALVCGIRPDRNGVDMFVSMPDLPPIK